MDPKFIVIGGMGYGSNVLSKLPKAGSGIVLTHEPGGTPFAEKMRDILLNDPATCMIEIERKLIRAGRIDHEHQVVRPALKHGQHVICDSLAYTPLANRDILVSEESVLHSAFDREQLIGKPTMLMILTSEKMSGRLRTVFSNIAYRMNSGFNPQGTKIVYVGITDSIRAADEISEVVQEHLELTLEVT